MEAERRVHIRNARETEVDTERTALAAICTSTKPEDLNRIHGKETKDYQDLVRFALKLGYEQSDIDAVHEKVGLKVNKNTFLNQLISFSRQRTRNEEENRALKEFALKLGYKQSDINAAFAKLYPKVDKNTFLNELISYSRPEPQLHIQMDNGTSPGGDNNLRDIVTTHPNAMIASSSVPAVGNKHLNAVEVNNRNFTESYGAGVVASGCGRTVVKTSQSTVLSPANKSLISGHGGVHQSREYVQMNSFLGEEERMFQKLLKSSGRCQQFPPSDLRHVVIDGSNVAMSNDNNEVFSCKRIALSVEWFRKKGHAQITVFVPQWVKERAPSEFPVTDQQLLNKLEEQEFLTFWPSWQLKGHRTTCYYERFMVLLADTTDGIIVSNNEFKDLADKNPKLKEVIDQRRQGYSFVNDAFILLDDRLGRHSQTLNAFSHKDNPTYARPCPYGRRCTYGKMCKFYHPEREKKRSQAHQTL